MGTEIKMSFVWYGKPQKSIGLKNKIGCAQWHKLVNNNFNENLSLASEELQTEDSY